MEWLMAIFSDGDHVPAHSALSLGMRINPYLQEIVLKTVHGVNFIWGSTGRAGLLNVWRRGVRTPRMPTSNESAAYDEES